MERTNIRDKHSITFIDRLDHDLSCHPAKFIGKQQLMSFEKRWPGGFNSTTNAVSMIDCRNHNQNI